MKILIIDREPIVRSTLQDFLEDAGHDVRTIETPEHLDLDLTAKDFNADVVIMETQRPQERSNQRIDQIKAQFAHAAIFEMNNTPPLHFDGSAAPRAVGVQAHLRKPIRLAELDFLLHNLAHFDSVASKSSHVNRRRSALEGEKS